MYTLTEATNNVYMFIPKAVSFEADSRVFRSDAACRVIELSEAARKRADAKRRVVPIWKFRPDDLTAA